jgi:peptidoglycan/xylan/chitin deacetylase (PgdA/CDA1 family)
MNTRFILSLDCEGKWGVADHLSRQEHEWLTDARLREAYGGLLSLLDEFAMPATFAFVGLFGESAETFKRLRPEVEQLAARSPEYLGRALHDIHSGSRQGWHGAWAVDATGAARTTHEIALHGVTHVPWNGMGRQAAVEELSLYRALSGAVGKSRTFIYPRNQVAYVDLLPSIDIEGYRLAPTRRSRAASLASEFNLFSSPEADPALVQGSPVPIPAGYFVNWQRGVRQLVPRPVSIARLKRMLARARPSGGVIHFWLHPENLASAPRTLILLRAMMAAVARERDAGRCEVMTQLDYVRHLRAKQALGPAS